MEDEEEVDFDRVDSDETAFLLVACVRFALTVVREFVVVILAAKPVTNSSDSTFKCQIQNTSTDNITYFTEKENRFGIN